MASKNLVILVGRLGKDPEMKYTPDGIAVAKFSIATSDTWKDKNSGEKQVRTEWHNIEAWRRLGEVCGKYLTKGKQIYIEGRLQTDSYEDRDGNKKYFTKIVAREMQMLGSKGDGGSSQGSGSGAGGYDMPEDDIPF
jgi:single-strand DNA-binding protein